MHHLVRHHEQHILADEAQYSDGLAMQACKEINEEARKRHWKREAGKKQMLSNITKPTLKFHTQYLRLPFGQMWIYKCRND